MARGPDGAFPVHNGFPAETIQIPVYAETCVLLDDLMAGGWYANRACALQTRNALTRRWKTHPQG